MNKEKAAALLVAQAKLEAAEQALAMAASLLKDAGAEMTASAEGGDLSDWAIEIRRGGREARDLKSIASSASQQIRFRLQEETA
jgi:hypothetical protein